MMLIQVQYLLGFFFFWFWRYHILHLQILLNLINVVTCKLAHLEWVSNKKLQNLSKLKSTSTPVSVLRHSFMPPFMPPGISRQPMMTISGP